jgi:hypothetical protein
MGYKKSASRHEQHACVGQRDQSVDQKKTGPDITDHRERRAILERIVSHPNSQSPIFAINDL